MKLNNVLKFIISIIISELAGVVGAIFTMPSIGSWYATLAKPALSPPNWVFGPVWTGLYFLMGVALFLVWFFYAKTLNEYSKRKAKAAISIFFIQLVLNTFWSIIFFGLHNPKAAFVELIVLWLAILTTIIAFAKISKTAAWLLLPYIIWVSFAGYLNYSIWQLSNNALEPVACTQEAKLCPNGSYVGRTGPKCEFSQCPAPEASGIE